MKPVTRQSLQNGHFQEMAREAEKQGLIKLTSAAERERSWRELVACNPNANGEVWVFAYGSLLWNPAFHWVRKQRARLDGFHRDFNLRTYIGRGCKEQPGLVLGLEQGGVCEGEILQVQPQTLEEELDILWSREMVASAYQPHWYPMANVTDDAEIYAIAFVMDVNYPHYAGQMSFAERCHDLAHAQGSLGCAADYLFDTLAALHSHGIHDEKLEQYAAEVRRIQQGSD